MLANCHQTGISTGINLIVGFPGEEEEQARDTFEFVFENCVNIDRIPSIENYNVMLNSIIAEEPEEYGVSLPSTLKKGALWYDEFTVVKELSPSDARNLIDQFVEEIFQREPSLLDYVHYPYLYYIYEYQVRSFAEISEIGTRRVRERPELRSFDYLSVIRNLRVYTVPFDAWSSSTPTLNQIRIAVDYGKMQYLTVKEIDLCIIELLDGTKSEDQICQCLLQRFGFNRKKAQVYYRVFVDTLSRGGYIVL